MQPIGNRLTALPAEIGNLDQLQEIYLTSNQLTELLVKLERLTGLRKLVVAANSFSYGETGGTQKTVSQTES
ncbi:MAG: hypothetical protein K1Y36_28805 [Blastocatellia bacterium]|nr:hypothetical protein [Blastocatellia bacterium]